MNLYSITYGQGVRGTGQSPDTGGRPAGSVRVAGEALCGSRGPGALGDQQGVVAGSRPSRPGGPARVAVLAGRGVGRAGAAVGRLRAAPGCGGRYLVAAPGRGLSGLSGPMPEFAHLHVASSYSLRYGMAPPAVLAARAAQLGMPALALTDRDGLWGAFKHVQACADAGIKPLLGADLALRPGDRQPGDRQPAGRQPAGRVTLLAAGRRGWASLCRLVSAAHAAGNATGNVTGDAADSRDNSNKQ